ncbi:MAG TPA: ABC-2 transporter permease [Candidatus Mcinerneyibacterium sp.]|nr:ABC-2 transporter permease [Candidatus Mcinerneyibacterium sp.]
MINLIKKEFVLKWNLLIIPVIFLIVKYLIGDEILEPNKTAMFGLIFFPLLTILYSQDDKLDILINSLPVKRSKIIQSRYISKLLIYLFQTIILISSITIMGLVLNANFTFDKSLLVAIFLNFGHLLILYQFYSIMFNKLTPKILGILSVGIAFLMNILTGHFFEIMGYFSFIIIIIFYLIIDLYLINESVKKYKKFEF